MNDAHLYEDKTVLRIKWLPLILYCFVLLMYITLAKILGLWYNQEQGGYSMNTEILVAIIAVGGGVLTAVIAAIAQAHSANKKTDAYYKRIIAKLGKFDETSVDAVIGVNKGDSSLRQRVDDATVLVNEINERTKMEERIRTRIADVDATQTVGAVAVLAREFADAKSEIKRLADELAAEREAHAKTRQLLPRITKH
jgi:Kef-type K+ transport system membrane component KefB